MNKFQRPFFLTSVCFKNLLYPADIHTHFLTFFNQAVMCQCCLYTASLPTVAFSSIRMDNYMTDFSKRIITSPDNLPVKHYS